MRVQALLFQDDFPRDEAIAISAVLQSSKANLDSFMAKALLDKFVVINGDDTKKARWLANKAHKAGANVAIVVATKTVRNLMSGEEVEIDTDAPLCCDPSSETYWSM